MTRSLIALVAMMLLLSSTARAEDTFHPSRVKLAVHGGYDVGDKTRLEYRFVPSGNLIGELAPIAFFGTKFKTMDWLTVETYAGFAFKTNDPLFSLSFNPHVNKLYAWTEIDWRAVSHDGYWFAQAEYQVTPWFRTGIEGEGWGNFEKSASWTHGAGPNVLFRFGMVGIDMAVQIRDIKGDVKPQFYLRTHLFL